VDEIGQLMLSKSANGVTVQGIFETTGSETSSSELTPLFCAGLQVRQDGNPFILHHKVFIVDNDTVVTGSFNVSANATNSNDENLIIIQDPVLAAQYIAEFNRRWAEARTPSGLTCH
jgi:phosphatidylserine/phosphatidylglycerophosphate/cardiolipin synthase-like enzyme